MSILVDKSNNKEEFMDEIKELYFANATLYLDEKDRTVFQESKPSFLKFLETD